MPRKRRRRIAERHIFPAANLLDHFGPGTTQLAAAEVLGIDPNSVNRWRLDGIKLSTWQADRYAIRIGQHPSMIWPDWFDLTEYVPAERERILSEPA